MSRPVFRGRSDCLLLKVSHMTGIDEKLDAIEMVTDLIQAGHAVKIARALDGCVEASCKVGIVVEVCHAPTVAEAIRDLAAVLGVETT